MGISDGSVVWQKDFIMGLRKLPLVVGYNHKETFTASGTFTAPITGLYKITLQGGGGGGACATKSQASGNNPCSGGGGGQGGLGIFYETLTAGTSYAFTIGAGGTGNSTDKGSITNSYTIGAGTDGGTSTITINNNIYTCTGGAKGRGAYDIALGGSAGAFKINDVTSDVQLASKGQNGDMSHNSTYGAIGGYGGGSGKGAGGKGGTYSSGNYTAGNNGGDGYITFEWFDPADAFPSIWAELEPSA